MMMQTLSTYSTTNNGNNNRSNDAKPSRQARATERLLVRFSAAGLFFVLLFTGLSLMTGHADGEYPTAPTSAERVVIVGSGETLWEIASDVRKDGEDIRRIVFDLQKRNNLQSSALQAGQSLIVPIREE